MFKDVRVTGPDASLFPSTLNGFSAASGISGVTFEGLTYNGRPVLSAEQARVKSNEHVTGVRFAPAATAGARTATRE